MTAICIFCGSLKTDVRSSCDTCGKTPREKSEQALAMVLTSDVINEKGLSFVSNMVKAGKDPLDVAQLKEKYDSCLRTIMEKETAIAVAPAQDESSPESPRIDNPPYNPQREPCPYCGEMIVVGSKKCRFCNEWLSEKSFGKPARSHDGNGQNDQNHCLQCGRVFPAQEKTCPYCIDSRLSLHPRRSISDSLKVMMAILLTLVILAVVCLAAVVTNSALASWAIIIGSAIWAGVDASKIELKKYKISGPSSTATTVVGCILLWIIVFPWYSCFVLLYETWAIKRKTLMGT